MSHHSAQELDQPASDTPPSRFAHWHTRVLSFCLVAFALEIGLFLTIYPWSGTWELNFIPVRLTALLDVWNSPALRAGVSAIGLIDMWIALVEFWRLLHGSPKNRS